MRGTGIFETCKRRVIVKQNQPIEIVFFGDVHHGSPHHCAKTWAKFCDDYRHRTDCIFVAMGDFLDLLSASERAALQAALFHESTQETWEDICEKRIDAFAESIYWMRGRLVLALEGNHHIRFKDGTTTAQRILAHLNRGLPTSLRAAYGGDCCVCWLSLSRGNSGKSPPTRTLTIAAHHGVGAGRTTGSMFNSLDQMERGIIADIYAMGDNHQRGGVTQQVLVPILNKKGECDIEDRTVVKLRTGSFLRGYVKGKASYVCDKMLRPANLGCARVLTTLTREQGDGEDKLGIKLETIA